MFVIYNKNVNLPYDVYKYEYNETNYDSYYDAFEAGGTYDTVSKILELEAPFHIRIVGQDKVPAEYLLGVIPTDEENAYRFWKLDNPTEDINEITDLTTVNDYIHLIGSETDRFFKDFKNKLNYANKLAVRKKIKSLVGDNEDRIADAFKLIYLNFLTNLRIFSALPDNIKNELPENYIQLLNHLLNRRDNKKNINLRIDNDFNNGKLLELIEKLIDRENNVSTIVDDYLNDKIE